MNKLFILTLATVLVTSCLPQDTQVPQSPLLPLLERKSGLIAYIGTDGNMYVSDQAGRNLTQVTDDAQTTDNTLFRYYQYPSWSKDGSQVAFVGLNIENNNTTANLFIHNVDDDSIANVYESQTEVPFYLHWSPDNANVSFITTTAEQNSIILQSVSSHGGEATVIDVGSPYYWSWSPDGSVLISHTGSTQTASPEHLSFIRMDSPPVEYGLDIQPASFQAPAWSPDGSSIALTNHTEDENQIIVTDATGENPQVIGNFLAKTAFAWSFDSSRLAYIDGDEAVGDGIVGNMHVYDFETGKVIAEKQDIASFFWSPDGAEIAYFTVVSVNGAGNTEQGTSPQYALRLSILDVETTESRDLFTYLPTEQFLNILPYFDQYHQSATIWSPDSNNLVVSFLDGEGNAGIAIVPASGTLEPRLLAPGYIAFWSWE